MIDRNDRHLGDAGVLLEPVLDLDRIDVLAAADDQVAPPGREVQPAALDPADVAGAQPVARADHLGGRLGAAPVAGHDHRAAQVDLALLAFGQRRAERVADLELDRGQRTARRLGEPVELVAAVQRSRVRRTRSGRSRLPSTARGSGAPASPAFAARARTSSRRLRRCAAT